MHFKTAENNQQPFSLFGARRFGEGMRFEEAGDDHIMSPIIGSVIEVMKHSKYIQQLRRSASRNENELMSQLYSKTKFW